MTMTPAMTILYVENAAESADFYEKLFGIAPTDRADTFSLFHLPTGLVLGLWSRAGVSPAAHLTGGGCELAIRASDPAAVDATHERWTRLGIPVLQAPVEADFGRTFTVADPDGHRIRVFNPPA
jgi:predicted enzyme related to lactoylglutathione lyase